MPFSFAETDVLPDLFARLRRLDYLTWGKTETEVVAPKSRLVLIAEGRA